MVVDNNGHNKKDYDSESIYSVYSAY